MRPGRCVETAPVAPPRTLIAAAAFTGILTAILLLLTSTKSTAVTSMSAWPAATLSSCASLIFTACGAGLFSGSLAGSAKAAEAAARPRDRAQVARTDCIGVSYENSLRKGAGQNVIDQRGPMCRNGCAVLGHWA